MFRYLSLFFLKILGWKLIGELPPLDKYIIILAPHTSNFDFLLSVFARSITRLDSKYLAKESLFKPPIGWFFRAIGGYPVNRSKSTRMVDKVIDIYKKEEKFILAIAPEGTRKKVKEWKSGFYYIAVGAGIPVVMCALDYGKREFTIAKPFYPTGNFENDILEIKAFYANKRGKNA